MGKMEQTTHMGKMEQTDVWTKAPSAREIDTAQDCTCILMAFGGR
jgi:hypothetical protein